MKNVVLLLVHLLATIAKLLGPGGIKSVVAENLLLKQQLLVVCRPRQRAPNLSATDQILFAFCALFLRPGRIVKNAVALRPSTLLKFHDALQKRKYSIVLAMRASETGTKVRLPSLSTPSSS